MPNSSFETLIVKDGIGAPVTALRTCPNAIPHALRVSATSVPGVTPRCVAGTNPVLRARTLHGSGRSPLIEKRPSAPVVTFRAAAVGRVGSSILISVGEAVTSAPATRLAIGAPHDARDRQAGGELEVGVPRDVVLADAHAGPRLLGIVVGARAHRTGSLRQPVDPVLAGRVGHGRPRFVVAAVSQHEHAESAAALALGGPRAHGAALDRGSLRRQDGAGDASARGRDEVSEIDLRGLRHGGGAYDVAELLGPRADVCLEVRREPLEDEASVGPGLRLGPALGRGLGRRRAILPRDVGEAEAHGNVRERTPALVHDAAGDRRAWARLGGGGWLGGGAVVVPGHVRLGRDRSRTRAGNDSRGGLVRRRVGDFRVRPGRRRRVVDRRVRARRDVNRDRGDDRQRGADRNLLEHDDASERESCVSRGGRDGGCPAGHGRRRGGGLERSERERQQRSGPRATVAAVGRVEARAELVERALEARADGRGRDAEPRGDLRGVEVLVEPHEDRGPVGLVEREHGFDHLAQHRRLRGLRAAGRCFGTRRSLLARGAAGGFAAGAPREVAGDRSEPRADARPPRRMTDGGEPGLLGDVVGRRIVDHERASDSAHEGSVVVEHLLEGVGRVFRHRLPPP